MTLYQKIPNLLRDVSYEIASAFDTRTFSCRPAGKYKPKYCVNNITTGNVRCLVKSKQTYVFYNAFCSSTYLCQSATLSNWKEQHKVTNFLV